MISFRFENVCSAKPVETEMTHPIPLPTRPQLGHPARVSAWIRLLLHALRNIVRPLRITNIE